MPTTPDSPTDQQAPKEVSPPSEVVIFVPGLGESESVRPAHIADLLCWELTQRASTRAATFASTPTSVGAAAVHRIERTEANGDTAAVLDVYTYDSIAELDQSTTPQNPLFRVLSLGLTAIAAIIAVLGVMLMPSRRAKSRLQLIQAMVVLLMVLCIVLYFGIAVFALIEAIGTVVRGGTAGAVVTWPQWIVLVGAVVGGLVPTVREKINWLGERSVQMARYTWTGGLRNRLSGGLQNLVDKVWEREEVERIHLVGYSFGSLVALETVYSHNTHPSTSLRSISSLITIGSPFDLVRMVNPGYGSERTIIPEIAPQWINIYQPIDVLGSNFRDDMTLGPATAGLTGSGNASRRPEENLAWNPDLRLTPTNFLMLRSLSVHGGYWDDAKTARNALGLVVETLYGGSPVLR